MTGRAIWGNIQFEAGSIAPTEERDNTEAESLQPRAFESLNTIDSSILVSNYIRINGPGMGEGEN